MADQYKVVSKKFVRTALMFFVSMMLIVGISLQFSYYIDKRSNQRWCDIVTLFNETYKQSPPPTETGKKIAAAMLVLGRDFDCEEN